jgi:hypothetical protein
VSEPALARKSALEPGVATPTLPVSLGAVFVPSVLLVGGGGGRFLGFGAQAATETASIVIMASFDAVLMSLFSFSSP